MAISLNPSSGITRTSPSLPPTAIRNIDLKSLVSNIEWKVAAAYALTAAAVAAILVLAVAYSHSKNKILIPQPDLKPAAKATEDPPKPFEKLTPADLFNANELAETYSREGIEGTLEWLCNLVLLTLKESEKETRSKEINIDRTHNDRILAWMRFGISEKGSFETHQNESWVVRTLIALRNKGYISELNIIDKSEIKIRLK